MTPFDEQLKQSIPRCEPPRDLHGSIMKAVRSAPMMERDARSGRLLNNIWLAAACALVLAVTLGAYIYLDGQRDPLPENRAESFPAMAAAHTALTVSDQLSRTAPGALVAPMERELELINRDLESTRQFLLASLP